jgi:hypothetical protein
MDLDETTVIRHPIPFPLRYTEPQAAVIAAAVAAESPARVNRGGTVHHGPEGERYAVFGATPLAYRLDCARCVSDDGFAWEIVPVVSPGPVGCWRQREAGRILHLVRDLVIDGAFVVGETWEAVWVASPWITLSELALAHSTDPPFCLEAA